MFLQGVEHRSDSIQGTDYITIGYIILSSLIWGSPSGRPDLYNLFLV